MNRGGGGGILHTVPPPREAGIGISPSLYANLSPWIGGRAGPAPADRL